MAEQPDFQQFAERCGFVKRVADLTEQAFAPKPEIPIGASPDGAFVLAEPQPLTESSRVTWNDAGDFGFTSFTTQELRDFATAAERHARLLQQIWEWANAHCMCCNSFGTELADNPCYACHVRSLLVGQQEGK